MIQTEELVTDTPTNTPVRRFFEIYVRETASDDMAAVVSHYTDPFLSAGPSGTQSVRVAEFAAALPKKKALFAGFESRPAQLVALKETALDSRYVLARTTWRMSFLREGGAEQLDVDSTFLIDTGLAETDPAKFKIVLYLTHQDLMQVVRDRGILDGPGRS
jgi:hypothetical protein